VTTLMAIKVPSPHLIPNDDSLVTYVEHGIIIAADTRFIWDLSKKVIPGDGLKVAGLSRYVLAGYSGDVTLAYDGLVSAQNVLERQGGSPDMIAEIVGSQLIDIQTKVTRTRKPDHTSVLLGIWLFEHPVLYRLESSDGFQPRECEGPEFAGHGGKELQSVFRDNLYSMPFGLRQRDKEAAELQGLPYDPSQPVEVRLGDLGLLACRSVYSVSEKYCLRGSPEVGGKVQVRAIRSDGIRNVVCATLDTADGRDVLEHRTEDKLLRPSEMGITGSAPTGESKTREMKGRKKRARKRKGKSRRT
jgi:hypothetical protein